MPGAIVMGQFVRFFTCSSIKALQTSVSAGLSR